MTLLLPCHTENINCQISSKVSLLLAVSVGLGCDTNTKTPLSCPGKTLGQHKISTMKYIVISVHYAKLQSAKGAHSLDSGCKLLSLQLNINLINTYAYAWKRYTIGEKNKA